MPVVSDPCSCQSDCLVCGRGDEPSHDCAFHVLLESMVFQERMLHGEPTEAKLDEILKHGKEYLPLAMLMTDENSVRWQTMYHYVKSGFPQHQGNSSRNKREYKCLTAFRCDSFTRSVLQESSCGSNFSCLVNIIPWLLWLERMASSTVRECHEF
ncbi:uncharacterized protein TNCV_2712191 [Trichonephila clavipes]|nr:uncharacterized protein TNCV_2712191 [Trichonephila clavipes]